MIAAITIASICLLRNTVDEWFGDSVFDKGTGTNGKEVNIIGIVEVSLLGVFNSVAMALEVTAHIEFFHKWKQSVDQRTIVLSVHIYNLIMTL